MRYPVDLTIPIELRRSGPQPLYEQIAGQLRTAVDEGRLAAGAALPSTRTLGAVLGVSRGVVATAYDQLSARGYLRGRAGSGSFVAAPAAPAAPPPPEPPAAPPKLVDLRPGGPGPDEFPVRPWRAAWRRASFAAPPPHRPPPLGLPELRRALAAHLRDTRGLALAGREVVVTAGTAAGLRLVLTGLAVAGRQVAVEDPAPPELRRAVPGGAGPVPLPVDAAGARVGELPPGCRVLVLSPDRNVPLGCVLPAGRRRAAAAWAQGSGGWLVEVGDEPVLWPPAGAADREAGGRPAPAGRLPALAGLAPAATVQVGGFAAVLGPGLGLGYAVVPAGLAGRLAELVAERGGQPPYLLQRVVAELLAGGTVARLAHRLGRAYQRKWRLVEPALRPVAELARPAGAGTAVLYLPGGPDGRAAAAALWERGVRVRPLAGYHAPGRLTAAARSGLVIGYGHLPGPVLRSGLERLTRELANLV